MNHTDDGIAFLLNFVPFHVIDPFQSYFYQILVLFNEIHVSFNFIKNKMPARD